MIPGFEDSMRAYREMIISAERIIEDLEDIICAAEGIIDRAQEAIAKAEETE